MLKWNKFNKFVCERCGERVTEIHYWDDGTFGYIYTPCKEELESGGVRKPSKKDGVLI